VTKNLLLINSIFNREEYLKRFQEQVRNGISSSEKRNDRVTNDGHDSPVDMSSSKSLP